MRRPRPPTIGRGLAVVLLCAAASVAPAPAGAQEEDASLDLRPRRPWFGPDTPLAIDVEVRNPSDEPLDDLRVSVALYERVRSRSALRATFEGDLPATPLEAFTFRLPVVGPGETHTLRVDEETADLDAFGDAPDGLYPLSVGVRTSTGPTLDDAVTALSFFGAPPPRPLGLLPVVVVAPDPVLDPTDGGPLPGAAERLDALVDSVGSLEGVETPFGLAVSPAFLAELAAIGDERLPGALEGLAGTAGPLRVPAAWARLPDLADVGAELAEGRRLLRELLGAETLPLVHPPGLVVDEASLEALGNAAPVVLVDGALLGDTPVTPARPVRDGGALLIPVDRPLGEAVAGAGGSADVSRALADTAMVYFERPGLRRTIAVPVSPGPGGAAFVRALGEAPWLRTVSPADAADVEGAEADPAFPDVDPPPRAYRRAVERAEGALGELESYTLEDNPVAGRLRAALGVARSTALWDEDWGAGRAHARRILRVLARERRALEISRTTVTFTSSRGEVPVTVINDAGYPVRVRIEVSSPKVRFPQGPTAVVERLDPPGQTVTFPAVTESSGTFPLTVTMTSPDGRVALDRREVLVRSTAVNTVALVLTSAAALFLVGWYGRRFVRRRRERREGGSRDG